MAFVDKFQHKYNILRNLVRITKYSSTNQIIQCSLLRECSNMVSKLNTTVPSWMFNKNTMCPFCFTFWNVGKFRFTSSRTKHLKKINQRIPFENNATVKCLVCHKMSKFTLNKTKSKKDTCKTKVNQIKRKNSNVKNSRIGWHTSMNHVEYKRKDKPNVKVESHRTKKQKNKKSYLTALNDLL